MEHSLSNLINSHVIVFHDGSYRYLTAGEAEQVFIASTQSETLKIKGGMYKTSAIQKILPYEDFLKEYPNKISKEREQIAPSYDLNEGDLKVKDYVKSKKHRELMIQGLKQFIAENETTGKAEEMLEYMQSYDREQKLQEMPIGQLAV